MSYLMRGSGKGRCPSTVDPRDRTGMDGSRLGRVEFTIKVVDGSDLDRREENAGQWGERGLHVSIGGASCEGEDPVELVTEEDVDGGRLFMKLLNIFDELDCSIRKLLGKQPLVRVSFDDGVAIIQGECWHRV